MVVVLLFALYFNLISTVKEKVKLSRSKNYVKRKILYFLGGKILIFLEEDNAGPAIAATGGAGKVLSMNRRK